MRLQQTLQKFFNLTSVYKTLNFKISINNYKFTKPQKTQVHIHSKTIIGLSFETMHL